MEWSPAAIINEELRIPHSTFFIAAKRESLKTHNSKFKNSRTMKKTYIKPVMNAVRIAPHQMLANSKLGYGEGTKDGSAACSREYDLDED